MPSPTHPTVLITGASAGLGLELARQLRDGPYHLILTARRDSMSRFAKEGFTGGERIWLRPLDVLNADERRELIAEIDAKLGGLDVLVNNAGFAFRSVLEHVQEEDLLLQMQTNFWGPMELVRLALPGMRNRRRGKIINVSSVGGMMAMPTMAVYSASKFALEGASESLFYELRPWGISVTLVEPGFIRSDSFQKVRYTTLSGESMRDPSEPYYGHYRFMTGFIHRVMRRAPGTPQGVARRIERVIRDPHPPLRVAGTPDAVFFDLLRRFLPRRFYHWLLYRNLPFPDCWGDADRLRRRCELERERWQIPPP